MPVNSFIDYPMSWIPETKILSKPIYLAIANQLINDITHNKIKANTKLPPQRELADFMDLNLSTITKAYKYCELRGYIYGTVGKGTFVSPNITEKMNLFEKTNNEHANLGLIEPFYCFDYHSLEVAREVLEGRHALELFQYENPIGSRSQIESAWRFLTNQGLQIKREQICILPGVQNALTVALISLFKQGDRIAVDTFTYSNFIKIANLLNIRLVSIENDDNGMLPNKLDQMCQNKEICGIFLMPSYSNPTNIVMNKKRKEELSLIIKKRNLLLIEDETYAFLNEVTTDSFINIIPNNTVYMFGVSKVMSAGLRIAFIVVPKQLYGKFSEATMNMNLKCCSINAEIVSQIIDKNIIETMISKKRKKAISHNKIYDECFSNKIPSKGFFQWLELPEGISASFFEEYVRKKGIHVIGSQHFIVDSSSKKEYIRVSLSSAINANELKRTLIHLKLLMKECICNEIYNHSYK